MTESVLRFFLAGYLSALPVKNGRSSSGPYIFWQCRLARAGGRGACPLCGEMATRCAAHASPSTVQGGKRKLNDAHEDISSASGNSGDQRSSAETGVSPGDATSSLCPNLAATNLTDVATGQTVTFSVDASVSG